MTSNVTVYVVCSGYAHEADEVYHQVFLDAFEAQNILNELKAEKNIHEDEMWDDNGECFAYVEVHSVKVPSSLSHLIRIET